MFNAHIRLNQVGVGMYLLPGDEPPLELPKNSGFSANRKR